ncbi:PTS sugar transporter subunit IIA [Robertmurraya kyonggiensis]|uniref:PTS glucose transporter subunit IIA n=1 Tax=Robertmurraya kyonggiensis TaxID=1037680 RepID=A0A4U1D478_9BACI|nr:PTS glucose transporter subunit IIA [Robertmurraya kyonggiensis]
MLSKLFGKKNNKVTIFSPVDGEIVLLSEVPDPVFAEKMMGDGVAIKPSNGIVVSPIEGKVVQVFPTKHAVGLETKSGVEILIHIGLETVGMEGEGFEAHVEAGATVKLGDKLITFNQALVNKKAKSDVIPVIITNTDQMKTIEKVGAQSVRAGQDEVLSIEV